MLTRRKFITAAALAIWAPSLPAQTKDATAFAGQAVFDRLRRLRLTGLGLGPMIGTVGMALRGTPYAGNTLELYDDREICSVNLEGLDCVTFYETALGFARMTRSGGRAPKDLIREITFTRYRAGKLDGYLSRLHYTSDWIEDNDKKGVVRNVTPGLAGAVRMDKPFDFMSTHPNLYRQLRVDPALVPKLAEIEEQISARKPWFVPNDKVAAVEPELQTGDIVGVATREEGLDCSHTGLVYVDGDGTRRFLNASSLHKQVVLGERLSVYANKYKQNLGVMIARPI